MGGQTGGKQMQNKKEEEEIKEDGNGVAAPPIPCKHILTHCIACGRWLDHSTSRSVAPLVVDKQGTATTVVASTGAATL